MGENTHIKYRRNDNKKTTDKKKSITDERCSGITAYMGTNSTERMRFYGNLNSFTKLPLTGTKKKLKYFRKEINT